MKSPLAVVLYIYLGTEKSVVIRYQISKYSYWQEVVIKYLLDKNDS